MMMMMNADHDDDGVMSSSVGSAFSPFPPVTSLHMFQRWFTVALGQL